MVVFETLTHLADAVWDAHEPGIGAIAARQYFDDQLLRQLEHHDFLSRYEQDDGPFDDADIPF